jgi:hypothetical protein
MKGCEHGIESIARRHDADRAAGIGKGRQRQSKQLIATIGGNDLIGLKIVDARGNNAKCLGQGVRITLERARQDLGETRHDRRAGRIRVLVRVELDSAVIGLEARKVSFDLADVLSLIHQRLPMGRSGARPRDRSAII